jgi:POT family proton-dependent oligopeptide transporter
MTPFFGGMLADRLLGARHAIVLGGLLMAAGHLLMAVRETNAFFFALALLILGNGFFKPNISTIVGKLYPEGDTRRDGGFTLFYMGINLGAALAPLVCGYVGETYGWHFGFGLATVGMLVGLAVFVAPAGVTRLMIVGTAVLTAVGMVGTQLNEPLMLAVNAPVAAALLVAAWVAWQALSEGPLDAELGQPPNPSLLDRPVMAGLKPAWLVYIGTAGLLPVVALMVSQTELAETLLNVVGLVAVIYLLFESFRATKIERERLWVVLIMMFFSMLFWAFFEQAGSSVNNFTDRNVDRASEVTEVTQAQVGQALTIALTQEQLGWSFPREAVYVESLDAGNRGGDVVMTIDRLDALRAASPQLAITATAGMVGMGLASSELKASVFQAANPIFILLFGLVFTAVWAWMGKRGIEPSTPVKFGMGLAQLGLGFGALWYGAQISDERGMVAVVWLVLGYLLHTTGELCLSPVGLSMVTRLSPARLVSTAMGAWFLATAFSALLSSKIAQLTGVTEGHGDASGNIPPPLETVHVYGEVFGQIAVAGLASAVLVLAMSPLLVKWSHEDSGAAKGAHH